MTRRGLTFIAALVVALGAVFFASPSTGAAPTSSLILGVNVHPEEDLTGPFTYNSANDVAVLNAMHAAGAQMVRVFVPWLWIQPNGPSSDNAVYLKSLDTYVAQIRARGMKMLMVLVGTPCWASSDPQADCVNGDYPTSANTGGNYAPTQDADAGNIAAYIVERWSPDALEVWNEPDTSDYFQPPPGQTSAAAYTALTRAVYTAVKAAAPSTTVVAGALALGDTSYLQQLYSDGIAAVSDAISVHPYNIDSNNGFEYWGDPLTPFPDDPQGSFITAVPAIHQVMVNNGDTSKPLWITEFGFSACDAAFLCMDEQTQAAYLEASLQTIESWPYVQVALVHQAWDVSADLNTWNGFGLLRTDFTRRPAYCVFAEATGALPNCAPDPLGTERTAQDDLTRAWVLARDYYLQNQDTFTGFDPAALTKLDASFSGFDLSAENEMPSPAADPRDIGIAVTASGADLRVCNVGPARAYCVVESTGANPSVSRGEAPYGVWAAEAATTSGSSDAWTPASSAASITLALAPATVPADGATSAVTATVRDGSADPVLGDAVSFSSSDPGEQISATTDHHDGTYSATITSSGTTGSATITATDTSAVPAMTAASPLVQVSPPTGTQSSPTTTAPTTTTPPVTTTPPGSTTPPSSPTVPAPPPAGTPHAARFAPLSDPHIALAARQLTLSRSNRVTLTLSNLNPFEARVTELVLRDGGRTLRRLGCFRAISAHHTWRFTLTLSAAAADRLRRLRRPEVTLLISAQAPAGDRSTATDRATIIAPTER